MIPRVTHQTIQQSTLANLQGSLSAMAALQSKMSSGKNISVPSDDPGAASDMLRLRGDQRPAAIAAVYVASPVEPEAIAARLHRSAAAIREALGG